jgi:TPR repeat protein
MSKAPNVMTTKKSILRVVLVPLGLLAFALPAKADDGGRGSLTDRGMVDDTGATALALDRPPSGELYVPVDPREATNSLTLKERAEAGDPKAQARLADGLLGNRVVGRFEKNPIEAYKWAYIASSKGNKEAEDLLKECDLFLSAQDRAKGKALAEEYLAEPRKESEESEPRAQGGPRRSE